MHAESSFCSGCGSIGVVLVGLEDIVSKLMDVWLCLELDEIVSRSSQRVQLMEFKMTERASH